MERERDYNQDLLDMCRKASELGASQAAVIPVADIVLDERAALKCLVPLCSHYGVDLMCPPNLIPVSQFRTILNRYTYAILVKVDFPPESLRPETNRAKADYINIAGDARKLLHEIVCRIESLAIQQGYHFAAGLIGGSCPLCEECVGVKSGLPCRHPFKARPSMEAMGIDVMATARKARMHLSFSLDEGRSWIGLVLVS